MKLFNNPMKILLILSILICSISSLNAANLNDPGLPTDDGDVTDNPGAPIAGLVPIAVIIGAGIGIFILRNKE